VLALVILEGVVMAMLTFLVVGLLKSHAEILRQFHELGQGRDATEMAPQPLISGRPVGPEGSLAHDLIGESPDGESVAIGVAGAAHHTLVAFLSSGCATCAEFWGALGRPDTLGLPPRTRLVAVTRGPEAESVTAIRDVAPPDLTVVMSTQGWESYAVPGSPYFVLVDGPAGAVIGEGTGTSWAQVQSLMRQALGDRSADRSTDGDGSTDGSADGDGDRGGSRRQRQRRSDRGRMETDDVELLAAGIGPGHASLFAGPAATQAAEGPMSADPAGMTDDGRPPVRR
jgi:hypothetical protein